MASTTTTTTTTTIAAGRWLLARLRQPCYHKAASTAVPVNVLASQQAVSSSPPCANPSFGSLAPPHCPYVLPCAP